MLFQAHEFDRWTGAKTGTVESYEAPTVEQAAQNCAYTKQLTDRRAHIGPTRRCVYTNKYMYALVIA